MDDSNLGSITQVKEFLRSVDGAVTFSLEKRGYTNKQKMYEWIESALTRLRYHLVTKKERGIILTYLATMTGLSRPQLKRLVERKKRCRKLNVRTGGRHSFPVKYTVSDIARLVETDNAHGRISGDATKEILRREFAVYGKKEYGNISKISVAHLYNLRNTREQYKSAVHQGDLDKQKGVYHVNLVDEVTQWEIIMCVEGIAEFFLEPALEAAIDLFPFHILSFHSDNGSEYVNSVVARLLEKLRIDQTKSRSRRTNDNALVEGKNGSRVRKHMGHGHIQKKHATSINGFYRNHMDTYLNYHRPCAFATNSVDARGKIKKKYDVFMTPYQKLCSLDRYEQYLKDGVTSESLAATAAAESDNECAKRMQAAKTKLFKTFTR